MPDDLRTQRVFRRNARVDRQVEWLLTAAGLSGVVVLLLMIVFIARETLPLLFDPEVTFSKLVLPQPSRSGRPDAWVWQPVSRVPKVSVVPLLFGSLKVTLVALVLAGPLGIAAALFTSELASRRVREVVKPVIELLAGIPSVVLGFFALMVIGPSLQAVFDWPYRLNAVVAGLAMAIAVVPIIFTVTDDALQAVPPSYREASFALGASRWATAYRIVLPTAAPGVLGALSLGFGRAIGETMIVLMASGNAAIVSADLTDATRTMSATIAAELGEVVAGGRHASLLYLLGLVLFGVNLVLNVTAGAWARNQIRRHHSPHP